MLKTAQKIIVGLAILGFPIPAPAQVGTGDTPAHRRIPLLKGTPPSRDAFFNSPEILEIQREYSRLSRQRRDMSRRSRTSRLPGETASDVANRERELTDRLRNLPPVKSEDLAEEIRAVTEKLGRGLGEALAETIRPGSVDFDPNDETSWDLSRRLLRDLRRERLKAEREYAKAKELLRRNWPSDSVAPEEWMQKVQPFINSEVIEQLVDASRQFEAQQHLPPNQRRFQSIERIPAIASGRGVNPNSMFDSIMTSIDKQSTDWLRSPNKDKSSLWKSFKSSAKKGITSLNRTMTANSKTRNESNRQMSYGSGPSRDAPSGSDSRSVAAPTGQTRPRSKNPWGGIPGTLSFCVLVLAVVVYVYRVRLSTRRSSDLLDTALPNRIRDRESLLAACHELAYGLFGARSRFWNHHQLFLQLSEHAIHRQHVVTQLAGIYEHARYAPRELLDAEFLRAKELFQSVQRGLRTNS